MNHHPVTSIPTNQRKVIYPAALIPNVAFLKTSVKTIKEFGCYEYELSVLFAWNLQWKLYFSSLQQLLLSHFSRVWLLATPWTVAHQAPPSMGFSRQEYWSGLPLTSPSPQLGVTKSALLHYWQVEPNYI